MSCRSSAPIIIREIPICDVSQDMTIEAYLYNTTKWAIDVRAYIDELINQIEHKTEYIDMRTKKRHINVSE